MRDRRDIVIVKNMIGRNEVETCGVFLSDMFLVIERDRFYSRI